MSKPKARFEFISNAARRPTSKQTMRTSGICFSSWYWSFGSWKVTSVAVLPIIIWNRLSGSSMSGTRRPPRSAALFENFDCRCFWVAESGFMAARAWRAASASLSA